VREADDLTTFMCRMSQKSGSLKLLEPSGPHRACYGTTLPLYIYIYIYIYIYNEHIFEDSRRLGYDAVSIGE